MRPLSPVSEWQPENGSILTSEEQKAGKELDRLFFNFAYAINWYTPDEQYTEALAIMRRFPSLASQCYGMYDTPPLNHLVVDGASLNMVRQVYELAPHVIRWGDYSCCRHAIGGAKARPEIVLFLLQRCPLEGLKECIFDVIESSRFSAEFKKSIIESNPQCHATQKSTRAGEQFNNKYPLSYAWKIPELLEFMVDNFPSHIDKLSFGTEIDGRKLGGSVFAMDQIRTQAFVKLLPQLTELAFVNCGSWTMEAFSIFMKAVANHSKLTVLHFILPKNSCGLDALCWLPLDELCTVLEQCLATNSSIRELTLELPVPNGFEQPGASDRIFQSIANGVKGMVQLKHLSLCHMKLRDCTALANFMAQGAAPESLTLSYTTIHNLNWSSLENWKQSRLKTFIWEDPFFRNTRFRRRNRRASNDHDSDFVNQLCSNIALAPHLHTFKLHDMVGSDVSEGITALLRNPNLRHFTADNMWCSDVALVVTESLKANNSLRWFGVDFLFDDEVHRALLADVLKSHNKTLEYIRIRNGSTGGKSSEREIKYWTNLNRAGRRKACDPSTTPLEFLSLLEGAATLELQKEEEEEEEEEEEKGAERMALFNCQYGLLREVPSLWSYSLHPSWRHGIEHHCTKKRKRDDNSGQLPRRR